MEQASERIEALEEMFQAFLSRVPDARVRVYAHRTRHVPVEVLRVACVRAMESLSACPSLNRLLEACRDVRREQPQEEGRQESDSLRAIVQEALHAGKLGSMDAARTAEAIDRCREWGFSEEQIRWMLLGKATWAEGPAVLSDKAQAIMERHPLEVAEAIVSGVPRPEAHEIARERRGRR